MSDFHSADLPEPEILDSHDPATTAGSLDILPAQPQAPTARRGRGRLVAVVAGVVAVVLVAAGGVAVGVTLSGGGTQPEELVPADAVLYADLDLDPSAAQKVNAIRFLRHFPAVRSQLGASGDVRGWLGDWLDGSPVSTDGNLASWLGQRFGVALLPGAGGSTSQPTLEVVVQVSDEDAARSALAKWLGDGSSVAVADGYAVVTQNPASAQDLVSQAHDASLASSSAFTDAMAALGDGVASFYLDLAGVAQLQRQLGPLFGLPVGSSDPSTSTGVAAGVVRFQPDAVELVADAPSTATSDVPASLVATLPDTTVATLGGSQDATLIRTETNLLSQRLGLLAGGDLGPGLRGPAATVDRLTKDLVALIGDQMAFSVDGAHLSSDPVMGLLSTTDAQRAQPAVDDVIKTFGRDGVTVVSRSTSDLVVLANDPAYAATLAARNGTLGDNPAFQNAVPRADGATLIGYVDLAVLLAMDGPPDPDAAVWGQLGASAHESGGQTQYLVRVTVTGG